MLGCLCLLTLATVVGAAEESWQGKKIMTTRTGVAITAAQEKNQDTPVAVLKFPDYTVLADRDGRLKVIHQGVEGWLDKSDAVLLTEAVPFFTKRVEANPKDDSAFQARALARMQQGEQEAALKDFDEAIRLNPKVAPWWNSRGNAHRVRKDDDKALADYSEALRLQPDYAEARNNRGVAHAKKKEYDKALADFNEAMRLDSKDAVAFNSAAWLLSVCPEDKVRDGKKAVELATRACQLTHWKRQGYIDTLAAAYAETGKFDEAVKYQQLALEDPGYQQRHGVWAKKVLEQYKDKKPYREE